MWKNVSIAASSVHLWIYMRLILAHKMTVKSQQSGYTGLQVYIYFHFSQSTRIFLVYIMFIIYNIRATSFGFMPSSGPL